MFHGNPLVVDSVIFVGTDAGGRSSIGTLYALNRFSGELLWKLSSSSGLPTAPCAVDSLVFVMTYADELMALNRHTGEKAWSFKTGWVRSPKRRKKGAVVAPQVTSIPQLAGDQLFLSGKDSTVTCLDTRTGKTVWSRKVPNAISSQLCLVDSLIAFGTDYRALDYLHARDGADARRDSLDVMPELAMAYKGGLLIFLASGTSVSPRHLVAVDPYTGVIRWRQKMKGPEAGAYWFTPRVTIWKDWVVVGTTTGFVEAYSLADGAQRWRHKLEGRIRGIGHSDEMLFVGTYSGMLYALSFRPVE